MMAPSGFDLGNHLIIRLFLCISFLLPVAYGESEISPVIWTRDVPSHSMSIEEVTQLGILLDQIESKANRIDRPVFKEIFGIWLPLQRSWLDRRQKEFSLDIRSQVQDILNLWKSLASGDDTHDRKYKLAKQVLASGKITTAILLDLFFVRDEGTRGFKELDPLFFPIIAWVPYTRNSGRFERSHQPDFGSLPFWNIGVKGIRAFAEHDLRHYSDIWATEDFPSTLDVSESTFNRAHQVYRLALMRIKNLESFQYIGQIPVKVSRWIQIAAQEQPEVFPRLFVEIGRNRDLEDSFFESPPVLHRNYEPIREESFARLVDLVDKLNHFVSRGFALSDVIAAKQNQLDGRVDSIHPAASAFDEIFPNLSTEERLSLAKKMIRIDCADLI